MSYHSKKYVDVSIFFRDMAFLMKQGENMRNPDFLVLSGPPGTANSLLKWQKMLFSRSFPLIFFGYETFKAIGKKSKIDSVRDAKTAHSRGPIPSNWCLTCQGQYFQISRIALKVSVSDMKNE